MNDRYGLCENGVEREIKWFKEALNRSEKEKENLIKELEIYKEAFNKLEDLKLRQKIADFILKDGD